MFEQMPACGCKPDAVSYAILISAFDRGNQWCCALQVRTPKLAIFKLCPHRQIRPCRQYWLHCQEWLACQYPQNPSRGSSPSILCSMHACKGRAFAPVEVPMVPWLV